MVSNQIIEVLNEICNKFGLAIDWTSKNVQPYLQELMGKCVAYKFANAVLYLVVGIFFGIAGIIFAKMALENWKKYKEIGEFSGYDIPALLQTIASGCLLITFIAMIMCNIETMITCKTFPEKVVLDMITQYMKG
jgi:H+/Cl- antiporter ClcA